MKKSIAAFISLLLLCGMFFTDAAWGATVGVNIVDLNASIDANKLVTVTGRILSGAGTQVTIAITDPGGQPEYLNTSASGNGGNFTFSYTLCNGRPGTYNVTLGAAGLEKLAETSFYYGSNAGLKSLSTSLQQLDSAFSPDKTSYTATVDGRVDSCTVTPTAYDSAATITVNGSTVRSGTALDTIPLKTGENTINILVNAPDGTQKTYSIVVHKDKEVMTSVEASASMDSNKLVKVSGTLSSGSEQSVSIRILDPQNNVEYVNNTTTTADGKFELKYSMANPKTGKYSVIIGAVGAQLPLKTCYFDYAADAALKNLYLSNLSLSQPFKSDVTDYTAEVGKGLDTINVTAVASDPAAKISVNGAEVQSGKPSQEIKLNEGVNKVTIIVTAQDGTAQKIYSVAVTKEGSSTVKAAVKAQIDRKNIVTISGKLNFGTCKQASVMVTGPDGKINYLNSAALSTDMGFQFTYAMTGKVYGKYTVTVGIQGLATVASTYFIYDPQSVDLQSLIVDTADLSPAFDPAVTAYHSQVETDTDHVVVTPTAFAPDAAIKVNDADVVNGGDSDPVRMNYGTNLIYITVTSADGSRQKTYTVNVERTAPIITPSDNTRHILSSDATLQALSISAGTLEPAFNPGTNSYTVTVANSVYTTSVTPTASESHAVITVNGTLVASGSASSEITLNDGANTIAVEVTAQDGTTKKTYTVTVNKEASPAFIARLSDLGVYSLDDGNLPNFITNFSSDETDYTINVPSSVLYFHPQPNGGADLVVVPVAEENDATFEISVDDPTCEISEMTDDNGAPGYGLSLEADMDSVKPVTVKITTHSPNGQVECEYTIQINLLPPEGLLQDLSISSGTLTPSFKSSTYEYDVTFDDSVDKITLTPTVNGLYDDPDYPELTAAANSQIKIKIDTDEDYISYVDSGEPSDEIPLSAGITVITVDVRMFDDSYVATYTIRVHRPGSTDAKLKALDINEGTLDPEFDSDTTSYTATVTDDVHSIIVTPTANESHAVITVNGTPVESGSESDEIPLSFGDNTITVEVTAQDETTTEVYEINVNRL